MKSMESIFPPNFRWKAVLDAFSDEEDLNGKYWRYE